MFQQRSYSRWSSGRTKVPEGLLGPRTKNSLCMSSVSKTQVSLQTALSQQKPRFMMLGLEKLPVHQPGEAVE